MDKNITYTKKDVVASLEYGERMPTACLVLAWILLILGIALIVPCFYSITQLDTDESIMAIIILFGFGFLAISIACYILIWNDRWNSKIDLWLKDAVRLEAKCSEMGSWSGGRFGAIGYKILVRFRYDGKRRTVYSGRKRKGKEMTEGGFGGIYHYYAGRVVDILYSPKYDQVMLLRLPKKRK